MGYVWQGRVVGQVSTPWTVACSVGTAWVWLGLWHGVRQGSAWLDRCQEPSAHYATVSPAPDCAIVPYTTTQNWGTTTWVLQLERFWVPFKHSLEEFIPNVPLHIGQKQILCVFDVPFSVILENCTLHNTHLSLLATQTISFLRF